MSHYTIDRDRDSDGRAGEDAWLGTVRTFRDEVGRPTASQAERLRRRVATKTPSAWSARPGGPSGRRSGRTARPVAVVLGLGVAAGLAGVALAGSPTGGDAVVRPAATTNTAPTPAASVTSAPSPTGATPVEATSQAYDQSGPLAAGGPLHCVQLHDRPLSEVARLIDATPVRVRYLEPIPDAAPGRPDQRVWSAAKALADTEHKTTEVMVRGSDRLDVFLADRDSAYTGLGEGLAEVCPVVR